MDGDRRRHADRSGSQRDDLLDLFSRHSKRERLADAGVDRAFTLT